MQDIIRFENSQIRTIESGPETMFVLRDVLAAMDSTTRPADAKTLLEQELGKGVVTDYPLQTPGGVQNSTLVSRPGLTYLVASSRTEAGRRLNKFIHLELLPSIEDKGQYIHEGSGIDRNLQSLSIRFADLMATYGHNRKKGLTDQEDKVARSFSRAMERAGLPRQFETKDGDLYVTPGLAEVIVEYINKGGKGNLPGHKDRALNHIKEHTHD